MTHTRTHSLDGLRGIALVLVMLFHLLPKHLAGGYIGVDIFFVVSGFVLYGSLLRAQTPVDFIVKRIVRLFPAIFIMCLVLTFFISQLGQHSASTLGQRILQTVFFYSSFVDATGPSYFQSAFGHDPLAHTWSLSVEMFISVLFAAGLALSYILTYRTMVTLCATLALLSCALFLLPFYTVSERYALFPFRLWGFLLGLGIAHALEKDRQTYERALLPLVGFICLCGALGLGHIGLRLPGAALATIGTGCLLMGPLPSFLSSPALVWMGRVSYGTYLWHLPLLVLLTVLYGPLTQTQPLVYIPLWTVLSFTLGAISFYAIERPSVRLTRFLSSSHIFLLLLACLCFFFLFLFGTVIKAHKDIVPSQAEAFTSCHIQDPLLWEPPCLLPDADILLWGDSHAGVLAGAALDWSETDTGRPISIVTRNGCPPAGPSLVADWISYPTQTEELTNCAKTQAIGYNAAQKASTIILTAHWNRHLNTKNCTTDCPLLTDMADLITDLKNQGKHIIVVGPEPEPGIPIFLTQDVRNLASLDLPTRRPEDITRDIPYIFDWLKSLDVDIVTPFDILCDAARCAPTDEEDTPYFYDTDHLSSYGATKVFSLISPKLTP